MNLLEEFTDEGLLPERVVPSSGVKNNQIPAVNPDLPQTSKNKADVGNNDNGGDGNNVDNDPSKEGGDKGKGKDPTQKADGGGKNTRAEAMAYHMMAATEQALQNMCEVCEEGDQEYDNDKKKELSEILEGTKRFKESLYEYYKSEGAY